MHFQPAQVRAGKGRLVGGVKTGFLRPPIWVQLLTT
jgi:hypothetical protein